MTLAIEWRDEPPGREVTPQRALSVLRAGLARAPDRMDLRLKLAHALYDCDRMDEAVELLAPAFAAGETLPDLAFALGSAALAAKQPDIAVAALRAAAAEGVPLAMSELAAALRAAGREDEALDAGLRALRDGAAGYRAWITVARILLAKDEAGALLELCRSHAANSLRPAARLAIQAVAAAALGDEDERRRIAYSARWVARTRPALPDGFPQRLAAELEGHPALIGLPSTKATKGEGRRLHHVQSHGGPQARQLLDVVREAIEDYLQAHPQLIDLGYPSPERLRLNAWALICEADGHEDWHIHPDGCISGVFYVAAPSAGENAGSIEFGPLSVAPNPDELGWPRERIQPQPGLLLLFPSHIAHRTWPSETAAPRICVAFDAVADQASA